MKVKAKCNIKYGTEWIPSGTVREVSEEMYRGLRDLVEVVNEEDPVVPEAPAAEPVEAEAAPAPAETPKPKQTAPKPRRTSSTKK